MNDADVILTQNLLVFGGVLFAFGMLSFLTRRSMILMFLSLELMLAGVSVNLIAFSRMHHNYQGQIFTIMILTVAACEAALALALVTTLFRRQASLDIRVWSRMNDFDKPLAAEKAETIVEDEVEFPTLTPAGLDPADQPLPSRGAKGWNRPYSEEESVEEVSGRA